MQQDMLLTDRKDKRENGGTPFPPPPPQRLSYITHVRIIFEFLR